VDIAKANTPAFTNYNSFHEKLNRSVKTAAVAFIVLEDDIIKERRSIVDVKDACYGLGTLWGGMPDWSNSANAVEAFQLAKHDLGAAGVVRAFSAFDVFMETLDGELNAWQSFSQPKRKSRRTPSSRQGESKGDCTNSCDGVDDAEDTDPKARVLRFFERRQWEIADVEFLVPIYTYFRLLRNCVAHADAFATPALQEASQPEKWTRSIEEWKNITTDLTMPIPHKLIAGSQISITYKEALLASSLLRMLAWRMSHLAVNMLGEGGMLYLLVSKILKEKPAKLVGGKQYFSLLHHHLKFVYRIEDLTVADTRARLEELGLWKEWKGWHESPLISRRAAPAKKSTR
jgi:hypothetical protein